jgi:hypothetical protein
MGSSRRGEAVEVVPGAVIQVWFATTIARPARWSHRPPPVLQPPACQSSSTSMVTGGDRTWVAHHAGADECRIRLWAQFAPIA